MLKELSRTFLLKLAEELAEHLPHLVIEWYRSRKAVETDDEVTQ